MASPDGKIRIPINESTDEKSQIEEFLLDHNGEGIQHIALGTNDIYEAVENLRARGVALMNTPDTYYEGIGKRLPDHGEDLARLRKNRILIDGEPIDKAGKEDLLLQIFTDTVIGPVFFEIIQRKGNDGRSEEHTSELQS